MNNPGQHTTRPARLLRHRPNSRRRYLEALGRPGLEAAAVTLGENSREISVRFDRQDRVGPAEFSPDGKKRPARQPVVWNQALDGEERLAGPAPDARDFSAELVDG